MSLTARVADYFTRHQGQWLDGRLFATFAGYAGFTARIRDLRKAPYRWTIENRVLRHRDGDRKWTTTEYRYVPPVASTQPTLFDEAPNEAAPDSPAHV